MKLAEYVADFVSSISKGHLRPGSADGNVNVLWPSTRVYGIVGAGAMHLNDAICNHPGIKFVAMHHEQAAAMAAEADARVTGKIGVVHVTAGPGGTNAITGIAGAWVDSIPMVVIAGQVTSHTMIGRGLSGLRQLGTNELDLVSMVGGITKYAVTVTKPQDIRFHLEKALYLATTGRQGPVWIEIPLDIQAADVDPRIMERYEATNRVTILSADGTYLGRQIERCVELLNEAKRPLIIVGNGVRLADARNEFLEMVAELGIPVVSSWGAADLMPTDAPLYVGRSGVLGDRASNFAVQNADAILAIGTRLSVPQIGHHANLWAPHAKLIMVDIDPKEMMKPTLMVYLPIVADAKAFFRGMRAHIVDGTPDKRDWRARCAEWKKHYPVMQPEYRITKDGINSYYFMDVLAKYLDDDAIIVTDVGAGFISAFQSLPLRGSQRLIHSAGVSSMGWGIPGAIGACLAGNGRQVVCLVGDGGAMLNLQELQTIAHHKLPIAIFVFCNNGYMTMQYTQATHFKREAASSPDSGMSCPDFGDVADAFELAVKYCRERDDVNDVVSETLSLKCDVLCSIYMPPNQLLIPRVQSRMEDGKFVPTPIEDMWPYLDREEFAAQMGDCEVVV